MAADYEPDWTPPLASSGVVDVRPAGPVESRAAGIPTADHSSGDEGAIEHGAWKCVPFAEEEWDFTTRGWYAEHKWTGERRILRHSRFNFHMTEARFRYLVENDFPSPPGKGPWTDAEIDAAMEDGA